MKNISVIIFIVVLQFALIFRISGQNICKDDTIILFKAFREVSLQKTIVYVDTVNKDCKVPNLLKEVFQKNKIIDKGNSKPKNVLKLTKAEKNYLLTQIGQQIVWNNGLFPNSVRIDSDSMWTYLMRQKSIKKASMSETILNHDTITFKELNRQYNFVYIFTKPIYIRDNTICLITYSAMCGTDCGRSEISFYKKENNIWSKWLIVSAGDY